VGAALPDERPAARDTAVLVVNWRREPATVACVRAIQAWRPRPSILVVDNDAEPSAERLRAALPQVTVFAAGGNLGFGGANNLALPRVRAPFVLLLNNDAEMEAAALTELVAFLRTHPQAGIAGPLLEAATPPYDVVAAGGRDPGRFGRTHARAAEHSAAIAAGCPYPVDYVPGTAAVVRTDLLRRLGGFDVDYFFSGEMADLCARARDAGQASYIVPTARARHHLESAADLREALYPYYSLRNRFLYVRRRAPRRYGTDLARWTARGAFGVVAALARGRLRRARALSLALVDGLEGHFGAANDRVLP
jgi:GT2 family glycosyltransferase